MTIETRRDQIEPWPTRADCIAANRRALALMLKHHGHIPPECGCSAEARAIRRRLAGAAMSPLEQARTAKLRTVEDVIAFAARRHGSSDASMTDARGSVATMRARREAIHILHRLLGLNFVEIGRALNRDSATIAQTLRNYEAEGGA